MLRSHSRRPLTPYQSLPCRARGFPKESKCARRGGYLECGVVRARVEPGDRRSGLACLAEASGDGGRRWKVDGDDVIGAASLWSGRRSDRIWFFDATMRIAARARVVRVRHTDRGELDLVLERAEIPRVLYVENGEASGADRPNITLHASAGKASAHRTDRQIYRCSGSLPSGTGKYAPSPRPWRIATRRARSCSARSDGLRQFGVGAPASVRVGLPRPLRSAAV